MHRHAVTKVLPYTPEQLFSLVGDVARYPEFVPWITTMRVWDQRETAPGVIELDSEAGIGFAMLSEKFSTHVKRDGNARTILVTLIKGPFRSLENRWRFSPDAGGCMVEFQIAYAFKSRILSAVLASNFDRAVMKLMGCFEARAKAMYAPVKPDAYPGGAAGAKA
ncbi:MAG TPA: SRPBCC family protein [Caulobacteraceae bacterium]|nr:SRPBCC family protein [Caulobacteraceae bacterium]